MDYLKGFVAGVTASVTGPKDTYGYDEPLDEDAEVSKEELAQLRAQLNATSKPERKQALKRAVVWMSVGRNVSSLFPDVLKCVQSEHLEIKKLVYLFVIHYAEVQPDLAILAINALTRDAVAPNPILRALALRTMSSLRVENLMDYICDPLGRALRDESPYVRKTAALCVAKLHDIVPALVEEQGLLDELKRLLDDPSPTVVANAISALSDVSGGRVDFSLAQLPRLIAMLDQCAEWSQITILESLSESLHFSTPEDAASVIESVTSRLNHINPGVVNATLHLIIVSLSAMDPPSRHPELVQGVLRKLSPSLISLVSSGGSAEMRFVVLRCLRCMIQKYGPFLQDNIKAFVCSYNEPLYVKVEKVHVLVDLVSDTSISQIFTELRENCNEPDMLFVRHVVEAVGTIGLRHARHADRCVNMLIDLLRLDEPVVIESVIMVFSKLLRVYKMRFEMHVASLLRFVDKVNTDAVRMILVWLVGEYCEHVENAAQLLAEFLADWSSEVRSVQLELISCGVKVALYSGGASLGAVRSFLEAVASSVEDADMRDVAILHARLLESGQRAHAVLRCEKPVVSFATGDFSAARVESVLRHWGSLSACLYLNPSLLEFEAQPRESREASTANAGDSSKDDAPLLVDLLDSAPSGVSVSGSRTSGYSSASAARAGGFKASADILGDLFGLEAPKQEQNPAAVPLVSFERAAALSPTRGSGAGRAGANADSVLGAIFSEPPRQAAPPSSYASHAADPFAGSNPFDDASVVSSVPDVPLLLSAQQNRGLAIHGAVKRAADRRSFVFQFVFRNTSRESISGVACKFAKNAWGLRATGRLQLTSDSIAPGAEVHALLPLAFGGEADPVQGDLHLACKSDSTGVAAFACAATTFFECFLDRPGAALSKPRFLELWNAASAAASETKRAVCVSAKLTADSSLAALKERLSMNGVAHVANRAGQMYCSSRVSLEEEAFFVLMELDPKGGKMALRIAPDIPMRLPEKFRLDVAVRVCSDFVSALVS
ncbi:AP-2 complex subunit beta [Porphyridium purpureum]|uniref:AP-2 complex subunit beta n=1 Tax=Porphyridium purpureum TaxID=35688 RepID=A0A5J4YQU1_PORPP|nr:AP-2 complex subunit beta [Porphyridium purpureum]|eukprot:POR6142..scf236_6